MRMAGGVAVNLPITISEKIETCNLEPCPNCMWVPAMKIDYVGNSGNGAHYFRRACVQYVSGTMDLKESIRRWNTTSKSGFKQQQ